MKHIILLSAQGIFKINSELDFNKKKQETIVIVPSEDVLLTTVSLPKLNEKRLLQALPFALEEKLIGDTDTLHFAMGRHEKNSELPIAIVSKQKMQHWLDLLAVEKISPAILIAEIHALPYAENQWYGILHDHILSIRQDHLQGFSCDRANIANILQLQLKNCAKKPETLHLYNISGNSLNIHMDDLVINEIPISKEKLLEQMHQWEMDPMINLLQGPFQSKQKSRITKKVWLLSTILTSLFLALTFISQIMAIMVLQQGVTTTNIAIHSIYKKYFPNAVSMVAPRERLEEKLKKEGMNTANNDFMMTLSEIGKYLIAAKDLQLESLDYHQKQFYLSFKTTHFNSLEILQKELKNAHFSVRQQHAELIDHQIKATLIISRGPL